MFPRVFFAARFFGPRYWPQSQGVASTIAQAFVRYTGSSSLGDFTGTSSLADFTGTSSIPEP